MCADGWQVIELPGADIRLAPAWLEADEADALLVALREQITWERHRIRLFGREHVAPRLSCWIGDADAIYTYSRTRFEPRPWPPALVEMGERVSAACGERFNGVLANLYRDGADSMGWHSDDERELGRCPVVASLSLGATRAFRLRRRDDAGVALTLALPHGSLLRMRGQTQHLYRHALPRTRRRMGVRLNLTFRRVRAPAEWHREQGHRDRDCAASPSAPG